MIDVRLKFFPDPYKSKQHGFRKSAEAALQKLRDQTCLGAEFTGWFDFPQRSGFALAKAIQDKVRRLDVDFDLVVVVGIGGSYLGARAADHALGDEYADLKGSRKVKMVFAGNHLCETSLRSLLQLMDKRSPIVNVISKSGTTTEPAVAFRIIWAKLLERYGEQEAKKRVIATTDPQKGALLALARKSSFEIFPVPEDMGGRFSVLSSVGLLPLALAGWNIEKLLKGADTVFASLKEKGSPQLEAIFSYGTARAAVHEMGKSTEVLAYGTPRLTFLAEWWKQLFGESEGKSGKGLFPASVLYTTDLHSLGQYMQDGKRNLLETFLWVEDNGAEKPLKIPATSDDLDGLNYLRERSVNSINAVAFEATKQAHLTGGVPCLELMLKEGLNEFSMGELFAFFETACAISAALLGVNPYDQPGVEEYKRNMFALLGKPGHQ